MNKKRARTAECKRLILLGQKYRQKKMFGLAAKYEAQAAKLYHSM